MATYCFSDLHAQYDLWLQIKDFLKSEDTVYCLGDCVDRGPMGLDILNEVLETPNITLLCGNHEDFIDKIGYQIPLYEYCSIDNLDLWYANGGEKTIKDFKKLSKNKQNQLIKKIQTLPTHIEYINTKGEKIYLCHAGRQPATAEIPDTHEGTIPTNNYIWDRFHLYQQHWYGEENEYCVHGHTPVLSLYEYIWFDDKKPNPFEIYKYCDSHKIDIDLGSFITHTACLLNLDTWEPIYFKDRTLTKGDWKDVETKVEKMIKSMI